MIVFAMHTETQTIRIQDQYLWHAKQHSHKQVQRERINIPYQRQLTEHSTELTDPTSHKPVKMPELMARKKIVLL